MIGSLRGTLLQNAGDWCLIETQSGVGYKVYVSGDTAASLFSKTNSEVFMYTYTVVREDALDLYGFISSGEKEFFEQVISVSGVGPKSGLAIVSIAPLNILKSAIASGDTSYLTQVSGVGKKSAQKIVLELQDKLAKEIEFSGEVASGHSEDREVMEALVSLGYTQSEARAAIKGIDNDLVGMQPRLTAALRSLG
jgi:Holliday junction DNA helicase RuvA